MTGRESAKTLQKGGWIPVWEMRKQTVWFRGVWLTDITGVVSEREALCWMETKKVSEVGVRPNIPCVPWCHSFRIRCL